MIKSFNVIKIILKILCYLDNKTISNNAIEAE